MRHIALLLFAQKVKKDVFYKKNLWSSTVRQTTNVFQSLTNRTFQTAKAARLPLFFSSDLCNETDSFGRQLATSIKAVLEKGFESVICIGNDCPQLTVEILQKTVIQLQNGQSVIGPDMRGGVYLIGIQKESFQAEVIEKLPWQTAQLGESLGQMLGDKTNLLPALADINAEIDLHIWVKKTPENIIYWTRLQSLLKRLLSIDFSQSTFIFPFFTPSHYLRPPPAGL